MVQWDELINKDKNKTTYDFCVDEGLVDKRKGDEPYISDITIERVNRAGEKIKKELEEKQDLINNQLDVDIGYKVFSLVDKPKLDYNDKQFSMFSKRESVFDTLYNMMSINCLELSTKIKEIEKDKLYFIDNCYYVVDKCDLSLINKNKIIYVDGYCDNIDLEFILNIKSTFSDCIDDDNNIKVIY